LQSRNKKSICVNLKSPAGIEIVKQLAADADILIENLRPGAIEALGLGWDTLHAINPKLTMAREDGAGRGTSGGRLARGKRVQSHGKPRARIRPAGACA